MLTQLNVQPANSELTRTPNEVNLAGACGVKLPARQGPAAQIMPLALAQVQFLHSETLHRETHCLQSHITECKIEQGRCRRCQGLDQCQFNIDPVVMDTTRECDFNRISNIKRGVQTILIVQRSGDG